MNHVTLVEPKPRMSSPDSLPIFYSERKYLLKYCIGTDARSLGPTGPLPTNGLDVLFTGTFPE